MEEENKKEYQESWEKIMGGQAPQNFDTDYLEHTAALFKNVWGREGLGRRERRLISITCIALSGASTSGVLEYHIKAALEKKDLTIDELVEWALHLSYYGGWPNGANAYSAVSKVKGELEK